jgi:hypothetical protein
VSSGEIPIPDETGEVLRWKHHRNAKISLESIALGQLETAILLYFQEGDMASLTTLAMASQELFERMALRRGVKSWLMQSLKTHRPEILSITKELKNFLKHGPDGHGGKSKKKILTEGDAISYSDSVAATYIGDSIILWEGMGHKRNSLMDAFAIYGWFRVPSRSSEQKREFARLEHLSKLKRTEFLQEFFLTLAVDAAS